MTSLRSRIFIRCSTERCNSLSQRSLILHLLSLKQCPFVCSIGVYLALPCIRCQAHRSRPQPPATLTNFLLQATPLRCDVIVGCEDGLLGCIMGCGTLHQTRDATNYASLPSHLSLASEAQDAAATALERIVLVATSDAADLEAADAAEAAAAAAAAIAAAESEVAGVFRAVRVHDAAVMCLGVMKCAMSHTQPLRVAPTLRLSGTVPLSCSCQGAQTAAL